MRTGAARWASLPVRDKIAVLWACRSSTSATATRWSALAARAKGIAESPLAGEEAITGPFAVLTALNRYLETLGEIERFGSPVLSRRRIRSRADGRLVAEVFPHDFLDRCLQIGLRAEVWMEPGVTEATLPASLAVWYRRQPRAPRLVLVLGAGNISSIGLLDVLYKLVAEGSACLLKVHPLLEYLHATFEEAFEPLVAGGYLRFVSGGSEAGRYLCTHPLVDAIHVTGSEATYHAIASANSAGKPISSELGNVSPAIVVPGAWSDAELRFQAEQLATAKLHNDGYNCIALQVLLLPAGWAQADALIAAISQLFRDAPERIAYYPGSRARHAAFVEGRASVVRFGDSGEQQISPTIVRADPEQREEALFETEAFSPILAVVSLAGRDVDDYLSAAVDFCNQRLRGNLAANLIVDPRTRRAHAGAVDAAIAGLRYGCIGVNVWSGAGFLLPPVPWGAYPENTPERIGSGTGVVHNSRLFSRSEKSVLYGPFKPPLRRLGPPWFLTHRNQARIGSELCKLAARPSFSSLAKVAWLTLTG